MQAQADLAQLPVDVYPSAHATPLGAAACARLALEPGADRGRGGGRAGRPPRPTSRSGRAGRADRAPPRGGRRRRHQADGRPAHERRRDTVDVAVIGAGIVGAAIARELAGTPCPSPSSRAAPTSATAPARRTPRSSTPASTPRRARWSRGWSHAATTCSAGTPRQAGIPVERTGAVLVAWTEEELEALPGLQAKAEANGYDACELIGADEVYAAVPDLGDGVLGGLTVPGESIICTWTTNLALATDAVHVARGCCSGTGSSPSPPTVRRRSSAPGRRRRGTLGGQRRRPRRRPRRPAVRPPALHRHAATR